MDDLVWLIPLAFFLIAVEIGINDDNGLVRSVFAAALVSMPVVLLAWCLRDAPLSKWVAYLIERFLLWGMPKG